MDPIDAGRGITIPASEVKVRFSRAGGPGGQNVNKRSTKVEAIFDVAASPSIPARLKARAIARLGEEVVRIVAEDGRTQGENRRRALERLEHILTKALAPPPPPRRKTKPSRTSVEKRIGAKKRRAKTKSLRRDVPDD
jgi:ribosome-associated protein